MKTFALIIVILAISAAVAQDSQMEPEEPQATAPLEQHEWLKQLVGEWAVTAEATMGPGMEPMKVESTESVRSIGDLWIVAEGKAMFNGALFTSILTLGYDPEKEAFIGTWIDSMHPHMWTYVGKLDEAEKVLTLETEGPHVADPTRKGQYRDVIEVKGPDHKVMTSSIKNDDGTWTTFMRADYRRK